MRWILRYAGPLTPQDLPVDTHMLIALAAPRPIFIGAGTIETGHGCDPKGSFLAAAAASPAWPLLGRRGLRPPSSRRCSRRSSRASSVSAAPGRT